MEPAKEAFICENNVCQKYDTPRFWMSSRFKFGVIMFLANILAYLHRVNMNMVIVCMLETSDQINPPIPNNRTKINNILNSSSINVTTVYHLRLDTGEESLTQVRGEVLGEGKTTKEMAKSIDRRKSFSRTLMEVGNRSLVNETLEGKKTTFDSEFDWDKAEISVILSSYYYGSVFTQVPASGLALRFGGKHVITAFLIITGICSLLVPIAAQTSTTLIVAIRILLGAAGGLATPAFYSLTMNWTKPSQRATLLSISISGQPLGIVIAYLTSGLLCASGWSTTFYLHGGLVFAFLLLWIYEIHSTPSEHPRISPEELKYLTSHLNKNSKMASVPPTPWKSILLSKPEWATILAHFSFNWSYYTLIINVPMFLKEAFSYVIAENGVYSALPYVFCTLSMMFSGKLSALIIKRRLLTLQATRKTLNAISLGGIAICILGAGQVTYDFRFVAVILICISCIFVGLNFGGAIPAYSDFAGIFSGPAFAIGNAIGVISVIFSAMTAGWLTPNGDWHEWQNVFYVTAGLNVASIVIFGIFGEASVQHWAVVRGYNDHLELSVEAEDDLLTEGTIGESLENGHLEISHIQEDKSLR